MKVLSILVVLSLISTIYAGTLYVSPFGNNNNPGTQQQPLQTISSAISKSSVGGTIYLGSGVYNGNNNVGITLQTSINIVGLGNAVISCTQSSATSAFSFGYSNYITANFTNLVIRDCQTGIYGSSTYYTRNIIAYGVEFTSLSSNGIYSYSQYVTVQNSTFNSVNVGILSDGASVDVSSSTFRNISSAVYLRACNSNVLSTITASTISYANNSALYSSGCSTNVDNSTFIYNTGANGAAINMVGTQGVFQIKNSRFQYNNATNGGAIYISPYISVAVNNTVFTSNTATNGGGIYTAGTLNVAYSSFLGNKAITSGGGFYCSSAQNLLTTVSFAYNTAPSGSAFYCQNCVAYSSGVTYTGNQAQCNIVNNIVEDGSIEIN